jgi:phosphopantothenoylcysteine decarboxylase / phosphopantothenate---cysteine ligase
MRVVVGITGGIAAYKTVELVRLLRKKGCDAKAVMTENACRFVGPLTFQSLTEQPVVTSLFPEIAASGTIQHTSLADWADITVIAPATANCIGKFAGGLADDFLSTYLLACEKPVLMAPAMNPKMYANKAVQHNISLLAKRGIFFAGPDTGEVACGHDGPGRMSPPEVIAEWIFAISGRNGDWAGRKLLVSAGPTREWIDPVRFITNRSSGKMGYAIAAAAVERGADVTLVTGPVNLRPHAAVTSHRVISADEMYSVMMNEASQADVIIMSAAVSDWKPRKTFASKWKKDTIKTVNMSLEQTVDILKHLAREKTAQQLLVGFAAETDHLVEEAGRKLHDKKLDAIVANDISGADKGFDSDFNQAVILDTSGSVIDIPLCTKREMADSILDYCLKQFHMRSAQ